MANPKMVCTECESKTRIENVYDMPQWFCPDCAARRTVELNPEEPTNTRTDEI